MKATTALLVAYTAVSPFAFRGLLTAADRVGAGDPRRIARTRRAIKRGEIVLHYQPKVSIATGRVVAVEALARWQHPQRGLLAPGYWLPRSDVRWLETRFGQFVLETAMRQAHEWDRRGMPLPVCVNLSPSCVSDSALPARVGALLGEVGVRPSLLMIEVTEEALSLDEDAARVARELVAMGVALALDDFGVGHSSLDRLTKLPISELKIDRRFVSGLTGSSRELAVVRSALSLQKDLDVAIVAEGVETRDVLDLLRGEGCDLVQGHLLGRPAPPERFSRAVITGMLPVLAER